MRQQNAEATAYYGGVKKEAVFRGRLSLFVSAILAEVVAHKGIHLLAYLARQIAHFLAHQVPAEGISYLGRSMMDLVKDAIEQLRGRSGSEVAGAILLSAWKVRISNLSVFHEEGVALAGPGNPCAHSATVCHNLIA